MPKRMIVFVPAILVFLPAAVLSTARTSFAQRAADDCITKPNSAPPQGSHWYFRVDRTVRRQCWYLGPEGAKVQAGARRAESPTRPPPRRPISPTPGESLVGAADARTTPAQFRAGENDADANFILRWPGLSPSTATSKPTSISNSASTSNSYAEEHPTTNGQDDLPLIWPVLTPADLGAAGPLLASAVGPERMLVILAGALAFAAAMAFSIFKRSTARPVGRSSLPDQRHLAADSRHPRARPLPVFAARPAAARLADFSRNSNGATHRSDVARPWPRELDQAVEESVVRRQVARTS